MIPVAQFARASQPPKAAVKASRRPPIIVRDANERVAPLYDRMPFIREPADYEAWLDPAGNASATA